MTGASLAEALVARGLDASELAAKQALFTSVLETHAMVHKGPPEHAWWVPGRLEVFGKHTDYAGGRTLVCAVPRGFGIVARARADGVIHVADAWRGDSVTLRPATDHTSHSGWRHYVQVAVRRLAANFPGCSFGADLVIASDLPRAAGMSSSSALVVGIATALGHLGAVRKHPAWKTYVRTSLDAAAYYACIENGRRFGGLHGDAGVGTHGGSEDHAAIVEGRSGEVTAFAFVPPRAIDSVHVPDRWTFVIAPSGVAARKTGSAKEPYNRLAAGAAALLTLWNDACAPKPAVSLAEALASSADALDRLRAAVRRSAVPDWPAPDLERRLDHFVREDRRVPQAVEAFRRSDANVLGRLSAESQADAETLLGNQVAETAVLVGSARKLGAFAASGFGAGFGGSVWALVERDAAPDFARRWHRDAFIARPGPPLTMVSP